MGRIQLKIGMQLICTLLINYPEALSNPCRNIPTLTPNEPSTVVNHSAGKIDNVIEFYSFHNGNILFYLVIFWD